jgi:hypothetical protein
VASSEQLVRAKIAVAARASPIERWRSIGNLEGEAALREKTEQ